MSSKCSTHDTATYPNLKRLSDAALETHLRDAIAEAKSRPTLRPAVRQILADELGELKAELLANSNLGAEEIARLSHVDLGVFEPANERAGRSADG